MAVYLSRKVPGRKKSSEYLKSMTVERKGSGKADVRCSFFIPYFQVGSNKELLTLQKDSLHDFLGKRIM